jgi:cytoskeletal protein CcmA (bactofilin family)
MDIASSLRHRGPSRSRSLRRAVALTDNHDAARTTRRLSLMLDTFRKRDNVRPTLPNSPGSRAPVNPGAHAASPVGTARAESTSVKPVLLDPPAPPVPSADLQPAPASSAPATAPAAPTEAADAAPASSARLIVGPGIRLKGADITDCDTIIVEGEVDASMDSRVVEIAEQGVFRGKVEVDIAEIRGRFEGELTAHKRLVIHETGRASGKIRYGKISIAEGGELSGDIAAADAAEEPRSSGSTRSVELRATRDTGASGGSPGAVSGGAGK